ncbi:alpha/beta fold hydrolase [Sphingomonas melonis]|uniref:Pimeloyl-ACP methyl ester carboxylesterase n=1 Tax=Sphingomonas melonis TaxID=152682 RepID=A0A7Y9FKV0_9SPHN|nr:alpha/beta hydrolase [Sphingomonas melonis]NYD89186.1 pimeloyl-ACP methyl ester carboxylesterase [Sphingomonas melonis]
MSRPAYPILTGFGSVHGVPALPSGFDDRFESYQVPVGDISLHAVVGGEGPPLLLLGGWPQNWYIWRDVMLPLSERFTLVVPDPRGLGISDKLDGGYDKGTIGQDLFELMTALGHDRFAMVGHDCGMWVGYAMAADQPRRIARIALGEAIIPGLAVSPPLIPDERPMNDFLWHNNFCRVREVTEALVAGREEIFFDYQFTKIPVPNPIPAKIREFYIELIRRDRRTLRASFDYYRAIDDDIPANRERMKTRLTMPVLGFAGELACAGAVEEQLTRVADDLRCVVIPDCGHFVPEEAPMALLELLTSFLEPYRAEGG